MAARRCCRARPNTQEQRGLHASTAGLPRLQYGTRPTGHVPSPQFRCTPCVAGGSRAPPSNPEALPASTAPSWDLQYSRAMTRCRGASHWPQLASKTLAATAAVGATQLDRLRGDPALGPRSGRRWLPRDPGPESTAPHGSIPPRTSSMQAHSVVGCSTVMGTSSHHHRSLDHPQSWARSRCRRPAGGQRRGRRPCHPQRHPRQPSSGSCWGHPGRRAAGMPPSCYCYGTPAAAS
mmetsp:Transcript_21049/g.54792  ORF Transcript_21049/g.54792 Transcript_21049/m.54792 type:complete len:235 (-) Transcript_21049:174-878(-)